MPSTISRVGNGAERRRQVSGHRGSPKGGRHHAAEGHQLQRRGAGDGVSEDIHRQARGHSRGLDDLVDDANGAGHQVDVSEPAWSNHAGRRHVSRDGEVGRLIRYATDDDV
jgi:hypothetical protein